MTFSSKKSPTEPSSYTLQSPELELKFDWKNCWYPVTFVQDFPSNRPYGFTLYDEPFVLFRNKAGKLACLKDCCPHRAAKLSDGQIIEGKLECLYHGWQFDTEGNCLQIPQLPDEVKIPTNACVKSFYVVEKQGMIWFWRGKPSDADENLIPILPDLDKPGFVNTDFLLDLPYDQSYLIENVMDPAHVSISHHNTRGGGNRKNAQPLEMEIVETSAQGIRGKWRGKNKPNDSWKFIDFIAPSLVLNTAYIKEKNWTFGLALYCLPLGQNKCRLLARGYRDFLTVGVKLRPRWLDHLNTNKILEQDLPLIQGQQEQIEQLSKTLKEVYLPLKTSDFLLIEYRKWLDTYASELSYYKGYITSKETIQFPQDKPQLAPSDRFHRHTQICSSCNQAYRVTSRVKQTFIGVAIAFAALGILADGSKLQMLAVLISLLSVLIAVGSSAIQTRFEQSYTRY